MDIGVCRLVEFYDEDGNVIRLGVGKQYIGREAYPLNELILPVRETRYGIEELYLFDNRVSVFKHTSHGAIFPGIRSSI